MLSKKNASDLAVLESYNNGSPLGLSKDIINALADDIRYFSGWADKVDGRVPPVDGPFHLYTRKEPIGVCGLILPWNVPLWALITKLAPCLAMGNVAVIKPAEQTPLTALRFAELVSEVGFPPGVVNIVNGYGPSAGAPIAEHLDVDKVAFTGSTDVGRIIMQAAARSNLKKVQLELGGKSPLVIFPDANLDFAVQMASIAVFSNNGQLCTAASRCFVHEKIYSEFVEKAKAKAASIKVGDQLNPENAQGPLVDKDQFEKVLSYITKGKEQGAKLEFGGNRVGTAGYFVEPTIFSNVSEDMTIAKEEIFGPVQSIIKFSDVEQVIQSCNNTTYGLAAGVISNNIGNVFAISNRVKAGTVWVNVYHAVFPNAEFGGYKQSGIGREGGQDGIAEWTQTKTVIVNLSAPAKL